FPNGDTLVWLMAAGIAPSRNGAAAADSALGAAWRQAQRGAPCDAAFRVWLFHAALARDPHRGAAAARAATRDAADATLAEIARAIAAGRMELFAASDPGRELRVAVRALSAAGEVGTAAERMARRATAALVPTAPAYAARIAVLDSLGRLCDVD